jgi:hypothetical protein
MVSCDPRATVIVVGQIALFMMTSVFAFELGVQPPEGPVLGDELPPQAMARAIVAATPTPTPNRDASISTPRRICARS